MNRPGPLEGGDLRERSLAPGFSWLALDSYEAKRRLAGARELYLFAGVDCGEDVGEVLLRVLGADLYGFRVVERGFWVNPCWRAALRISSTRAEMLSKLCIATL